MDYRYLVVCGLAVMRLLHEFVAVFTGLSGFANLFISIGFGLCDCRRDLSVVCCFVTVGCGLWCWGGVV